MPPPHVAPLVDRDEDVIEVAALLDAARLVTLTGPGGVGKTSLALAVASAAGERFPDGVFIIPLAQVDDAARVLATIAEHLGGPGAGGASDLDRLRYGFADRKALVLLDNLEHLAGVAAPVTRLLDVCPELTILATSRSPLRLRAERTYPVQPLALPSLEHPPTAADVVASGAVRLLRERARGVAPSLEITDENAAAVTAICRRLDGLPLAIELAAGWLRVLPPTVLDEPADEVLHALDRFTERSLVVAHPVGERAAFSLLETIRAFAVEALDSHGELDGAIARLGEWALAFARDAEQGLEGPDQAAWLQRTERLQPHIGAAVVGLTGRNTEQAGELCWALRWWWYVRRPADGRALVASVTDQLKAGVTRARCLTLQSWLAMAQAQVADALELQQRALVEARACGDGLAVTLACLVGGLLYPLVGDFESGSRAIDEAAQEAARLDHTTHELTAALLAARLRMDSDDLPGARELLQAIEPELARGTPWLQVLHCNLTALVEARQGHPDRAFNLLHRGIRLSRELGDMAALSYALPALGDLLLSLGRADDAARIYGATDALERLSGAAAAPPETRAVIRRQREDALNAQLGAAAATRAWEQATKGDLWSLLDRILATPP